MNGVPQIREQNRSLRISAIGLSFVCLLPFGVASRDITHDRSAARTQFSPIQLRLERASGRVFSVSLHNASDTARILNVGVLLANGREQYANRIRLILRMPGNKVLHLEMKQPTGAAGRLDPMVIPLPASATFTLRADLDQYCAPANNVWTLNLKPGQYSLRAEYSGVGVPLRAANGDMQGLSLMPYWTGTVVSDTVMFDVT